MEDYYLTDSLHGHGGWGEGDERENDHCYPEEGEAEPACCEIPPGIDAPKPGTTLQTLVVLTGWYRHSLLSAVVLPCRYDFECMGMPWDNSTGNSTGGPSECNEGYEGPLCR